MIDIMIIIIIVIIVVIIIIFNITYGFFKFNKPKNYFKTNKPSSKTGKEKKDSVIITHDENEELENKTLLEINKKFIKDLKQLEFNLVHETINRSIDKITNIERYLTRRYDEIVDRHIGIEKIVNSIECTYNSITGLEKSIKDTSDGVMNMKKEIPNPETAKAELNAVLNKMKERITDSCIQHIEAKMQDFENKNTKQLHALHEEIRSLKNQNSIKTEKIEWIDELKKVSNDNETIDKIAKIAAALVILPKNEKRFPSAFRTLSYELGIQFFRVISINNINESYMLSLIQLINNWLENKQYKYEYLVPKLNDSYDPDIHQPSDGKDPDQRNEIAIVSNVLCWGIRDKILKSTFVRAEVQFDRSSRGLTD